MYLEVVTGPWKFILELKSDWFLKYHKNLNCYYEKFKFSVEVHLAASFTWATLNTDPC